MDASPSQGFNSENSTQTREGIDNIELNTHELWNELNPSDWQLAEYERDQLRGNDVVVQHWLQNQGNSQPAQGIFINSQSLHQRKRETSNLLVHFENVFGNTSKPSSAQAARTCDPAALRPRNPTASNIIPSIDERWSQKPRPTVQSTKPSSTTADRKAGYPDNDNHDGGRPPSNWITQERSIISATPFRPESRGALKQSVDPSSQQTAWSVAGTNTSSSSKKPPKRQNSRSIDDDTSRKHAFSKRNRSAINDHSWRRTSPTSSSSVHTGLAVPQKPVVAVTPAFQLGIPDNAVLSAYNGPSSSGARRDRSLHNQTSKLVSYEDFEDRCETCTFWLYDPVQFTSTERQACQGRKEEVSHIVTHVSDHHGLIRGRDPSNPSRKYLASCHTHNPSIKAKGNCVKCSSLHNWEDKDFADSEHHGVALCLRCWCKFDKKGMQTHMTEPLCTYNSEQLKQKKVCVLYTTFCSETKAPGEPPEYPAPRKSISRPASSRSHGSNSRQQANNQQARRPKQGSCPRSIRSTSSHVSRGQEKKQVPQAPSIPSSTQDQPVMGRHAPTSHHLDRPHNQQAVARNQPILQHSDAHQPHRNPIAVLNIYPDTSPENIVNMVKTAQRNENQEAPLPPRFQSNRPTHFGSMINQGNSPVNGFQQQGYLLSQSMSSPPGQYHNWEQPPPHVPQISILPYSQNFDQTRQQRQSYGNAPFAQALQHRLAPPGFFQQPPNQFFMHESPANNTQQQSLTQLASVNTTPVPFDPNRRMLEAYISNLNMLHPRYQPEPQRQTISMSDLDATVSQSGGMSQIQSSPSRVASTAGESMHLLKSPDLEEPLWLSPDSPDDSEDRTWLNFIGTHPMLQKQEPAGASQPRPLTDQLQDLKSDDIPVMQQASLEKESGYYTMGDDNAAFVNRMFTDSFL
ncbi:Ff.00g023900.m01.CDS01 [Fusarium sp. VM40]|nr:Ff.00g023900.m01.CDS01 [Fusarium sp. VM40]